MEYKIINLIILFKSEINYSDNQFETEKVLSDFINRIHDYELFTIYSVLSKLLPFAHCFKDNLNSSFE